MKGKQLFDDDSAVSPVIGVILMVAITVILAAVIGTFVLGLGDQVSDSAPQASFNFEFNGTTASDGVNITHEGGDKIDGSSLEIVGPDGTSVTWGDVDVTAGTTKMVSNGNIGGVSSGDEVRVVWSSSSGGDTQTIAKAEVP